MLRLFPWRMKRIDSLLRSGSGTSWLVKLSLLALLVRIPVLLFPSPLYSDMFYYYRAAKLLASGAPGAWGREGLGIFFPPGQSIWLSWWISIFGDHVWIVPLAQSILSIASLPFLYRAFAPSSELSARIVCVVAAIYPSLILWSGTAGHEITQIFFLALLLFLYTQAADTTGWHAVALCAAFGLALGSASLVRPTFPILLLLTLTVELIHSKKRMRVISGSAIALACAALVIAPWTIRNYREYGHFCPISAQGGFTLLAVVHPESNGVSPHSSDSLGRDLDLVSRDQLHMQVARQVILHDPVRVMRLGLRKIIWEWGTDSSSMDAVVGDPPRGGEAMKRLFQAVVNVFWAWLIVAWTIGSLAEKPWRQAHSRAELWSAMLVLTVFALHALFEPQARHHFPAVPFIAAIGGPGYLRWLAGSHPASRQAGISDNGI
jgi:4-amino-4-deoxy-L-arabinose transferase-like glycosyltransferase